MGVWVSAPVEIVTSEMILCFGRCLQMIWDGFSFEWWNEWLIGERSSNRLCHHGRQNGSADQSLLRRFLHQQQCKVLDTLETVSGNRAYSVNYESLKSNILWRWTFLCPLSSHAFASEPALDCGTFPLRRILPWWCAHTTPLRPVLGGKTQSQTIEGSFQRSCRAGRYPAKTWMLWSADGCVSCPTAALDVSIAFRSTIHGGELFHCIILRFVTESVLYSTDSVTLRHQSKVFDHPVDTKRVGCCLCFKPERSERMNTS